jgi:hypothetical protein
LPPGGEALSGEVVTGSPSENATEVQSSLWAARPIHS